MSEYNPIQRIKVGLDFGQASHEVGMLGLRNGQIFFEYSPTFIGLGLAISPFKLPLQPGLQSFAWQPFEGLPGVFNDSLPDGWGRLLLDRYLKSQGVLPAEVTALDRLAFTGATGLGALVYQPDHSLEGEGPINLDVLAAHTQEMLQGGANEVLQELIDLNGASAGARPKALVGIDANRSQLIHGKQALPQGYSHWMVKFANSTDGPDAGAIEYVYGLMARAAGLDMAPIHLFPAKYGAGYFATQRFDRSATQRWHMHTASGLLHANFRMPSLDYEDLLTLTEELTKDSREVKKMYRLAVFNVLAHNRDDHGKNFSFLMDRAGQWKLSPAYDITFSSGPAGQQSTMVLGQGKAPGIEHLQKLGAAANLSMAFIKEVIAQTQEALQQWPTLAKNHGVSNVNIKLIGDRLGM